MALTSTVIGTCFRVPLRALALCPYFYAILFFMWFFRRFGAIASAQLRRRNCVTSTASVDHVRADSRSKVIVSNVDIVTHVFLRVSSWLLLLLS